MPDTISIAELRAKIWAKELYKDVMDGLYFIKNGMMGKGENVIVELKDELKKEAGDTINFGLTMKLSGAGIVGDADLEGNEEAIQAFSESISIDQWRNAVRLRGKLDEKINAYDMRSDAKNKLSTQLQEFIERQIFLKLGGVRNLTLVDVSGAAYATRALWANSPDVFPDADTAAGRGARYLCANPDGADALVATDLITPDLISRAKKMAQLASPKIKPLRIDGKEYYVLFVHPMQAFDLRNNATFNAALRDAAERGKDNPLFTGALGVWDGVVIHEHEYVPFLNTAVAGRNFGSATDGTVYSANAFRALLCGQQAAGFAKCDNANAWNEKTFDYGNKVGFSTGIIGGIQKIMFNAKEYGVIAIDTAGTALI